MLLPAGVYAFSNCLPNDKTWPKMLKGVQEVNAILADSAITRGELHKRLFTLLSDKTLANDNELLLNTGLPATIEKFLSPIFIEPLIKQQGIYGTYISPLVSVDKWGKIDYLEKVFSSSKREQYILRHQAFNLLGTSLQDDF